MKSRICLLLTVCLFTALFCGCSEESPENATLNDLTFIKTFKGNYYRPDVKVLESTDKYYYIAGSRISDSSSNHVASVVKTDIMGNQIYDKNLEGIYQEIIYDFVETRDGNFLIAGEVNPISASHDAFALKINAEGYKIWEKTYGGANEDWFNSIVELNDGSIILAGSSKSFHEHISQFYLQKIESSNSEIWNRTFPDVEDNLDTADFWAYDACLANDGNVFVQGIQRTYGTRHLTKTMVIKVDTEGNLIWSWVSDFSEGNEFGRCIVSTNDGGVVIAGEMSPDDRHPFLFMAKLDENGNQEWLRPYESYTSCDLNDIVITPDNEFLMTGHQYGHTSSILLFKADSEGNPVWRQWYNKPSCPDGNSIFLTQDDYVLVSGLISSASYRGIYLFKSDINGWVGGDLP